jgi:uncharacterized protein (DUF1330 family)
VLLIVLITIRRDELAIFRNYEHAAAGVMARHGGRIERAYVLEDDGAYVRELHVVRFPDDTAFEAYRRDPALTARSADRTRAVISTEIWPAQDGPRY